MGNCRILSLVFVFCWLPWLSQTAVAKNKLMAISIQSGGIERSAMLYVPERVQRETKPALVVVLHGGGGDAAQVLEDNGWIDKAQERGFIALAPQGLGVRPKLPKNARFNPAVWNSGQYPTGSPIAAIDDVGFVNQLLKHVRELVDYNESKIYVTGHSNGAGMTFRLGAELSEKFAALALVAGRLTVVNPQPKKALPTLYIVGTVDPLMPLAGGEIQSPWGGSWSNRPIAEQSAAWARAIQCETEPKTVTETNTLKTVVYSALISRANTREGTQSPSATLTVTYLKGHGHNWPGAKQTVSSSVMGPNVSDLHATNTIWEFFSQF
jgi:polyhydroxybutyrate depolymerase